MKLRLDREPGSVSQTGAEAGLPLGGKTPAIEVRHLTKNFGGRVAVADVSFTVARGEVFGFLGPNGAGKTTTVRILGTLISATAGSATVAGIPVGPAGAAQIRQRISVMPESSGLYQRLTVTENLEYFARLYGLPRREARISEALAAVGLGDRAHDLAGSLSKGLRQRAALARSLPAGHRLRRLPGGGPAVRPGTARDRPTALMGKLLQKGEKPMSATLRMSRETFGIELRRGRFEIWVDGHSTSSIDFGKTIEVPVEPGHHVVQVRAGRYSSRELPFDVADGDAVDFRCSGAIFWPRWVLSFVLPDLGILLKHD